MEMTQEQHDQTIEDILETLDTIDSLKSDIDGWKKELVDNLPIKVGDIVMVKDGKSDGWSGPEPGKKYHVDKVYVGVGQKKEWNKDKGTWDYFNHTLEGFRVWLYPLKKDGTPSIKGKKTAWLRNLEKSED